MWRGYRAGRLGSLAASLVLFLLAGVARGEDKVAASWPPAIDGNGGIISHPPVRSVASDESPVERRIVPSIEHRSILLDLDKLVTPAIDEAGVLDEVAPGYDCPGSIMHSYHGIQSVAVRRILGYYRRLFNEDLKACWAAGSGYQSCEDIDRRIQRMAEAQADLNMGGRWWDRTWKQSLTPQMGGAPAEARMISIGQEIEIFRFGEIAFTNEGKLRCGRLSVYLDDDRIYERFAQKAHEAAFTAGRARADANLSRSGDKDKDKLLDKPQQRVAADESHLDVSVGFMEDDAAIDLDRVLSGTERERARPVNGRFQTPRGSLFTGEGWNASLHPNLQLRLPDSSSQLPSAISNASLELDINLYPGEARQLWGVLMFKVAASPRDNNNLVASIELDILRW